MGLRGVRPPHHPQLSPPGSLLQQRTNMDMLNISLELLLLRLLGSDANATLRDGSWSGNIGGVKFLIQWFGAVWWGGGVDEWKGRGERNPSLGTRTWISLLLGSPSIAGFFCTQCNASRFLIVEHQRHALPQYKRLMGRMGVSGLSSSAPLSPS